jgi:hypothetical protein
MCRVEEAHYSGDYGHAASAVMATDRAPSLGSELTRVGELGAYYAFSEHAMALGGSMGGTRALSVTTGCEFTRSRSSSLVQTPDPWSGGLKRRLVCSTPPLP